jgi:hypothetical protein
MWFQRRPVFSDLGEVAAWFVDERKDKPQDLWWVDLTADEPKPVQTTITSSDLREIALSPDGTRVLMTTRSGLVSVYELVDESLVSMARLPNGFEESDCSFVDEATVRCQPQPYLWEDENTKWRVAELDTDTGEISVTGEIDLSEIDPWRIIAETSSSLMVLKDCPGENCRLRLHDPRTGVLQKERPLPEWTESASFLRDGRLFVSQYDDDSGRTLAIGLENAETGEWIIHQFDESPGVRLGHEALPAQLIKRDLERDLSGFGMAVPFEIFNLETGETRRIDSDEYTDGGLGTLQGPYWSLIVPVQWEPGIWHFLLNTSKGVIRWDPETDELVTVAGGAG